MPSLFFQMQIHDIHHVQITVAPDEVDAARRFYCGVLGLSEIEKPDSLKGRGGFWVLAGSRQVHIGIEDGVNRHATKAHIAYQVDDLAAWHQHLTTQGISIGDSVPIPGFDRFEFRDPFGNRIEFIQPR